MHIGRCLFTLTLALVGCKSDGKKSSSSSSTPPPAAAKACPSSFKDLPAGQAQTTCTCAPDSGHGSVWGVDTYTQDSSLCAAAVHAGAIPASGGEVTVKAAAGCPSYASAVRNGISSGSWGDFPGSFYFVGKGDGACHTQAAAAPPKPCPATFKDIAGGNASIELTCSCTAPQPSSVWGNGIYTLDSSICVAAVHAGAIPAAGGTVTLKGAAGCPKYSGSTANGMTSQSWGSYDGSFYFPSKGDGHCAS